MSWSISAKGTRNEVAKSVREQLEQAQPWTPAVRDALAHVTVAAIDSLPDAYPVEVSAWGHTATQGEGGSFHVAVSSQQPEPVTVTPPTTKSVPDAT